MGDIDYGRAVDVWASGSLFAELLTSTPLFAGESDIDQLYQIMRCLGPLPSRFSDCFARNSIYVGVKLPVAKLTEPLAKKFPTLDKPTLSMMKTCLRYEPEERDSCSKLLAHPYFAGFEEWFKTEHKQALQRDKEELMSQSKEHQQKKGGAGGGGGSKGAAAGDKAGKKGGKGGEDGAPTGSPRDGGAAAAAVAAASAAAGGGSGGSRVGSAEDQLLSGDDTVPTAAANTGGGGGKGSSPDISDLNTGGAPLVLDQLGSGHSARGSKHKTKNADGTGAAAAAGDVKHITHSMSHSSISSSSNQQQQRQHRGILFFF